MWSIAETRRWDGQHPHGCLRKAFRMNKTHQKLGKPHSFKHDTHGLYSRFLPFLCFAEMLPHCCRLSTIFPSVVSISSHLKVQFSCPVLVLVRVSLWGKNTTYEVSRRVRGCDLSGLVWPLIYHRVCGWLGSAHPNTHICSSSVGWTARRSAIKMTPDCQTQLNTKAFKTLSSPRAGWPDVFAITLLRRRKISGK